MNEYIPKNDILDFLEINYCCVCLAVGTNKHDIKCSSCNIPDIKSYIENFKGVII